MKRIVPFSSQIHERPSPICACVRQRKPSGSRSSGLIPISSSCAAAHAGTSSVEVGERRLAQAGLARLRRLLEHVDGLARPVLARSRHPRAGRVPQLVDRVLLADHHPRAARRGRAPEGAAAHAGRHDVRADVAERRQRAVRRASAENRPSPRRATSSRKTRSTGSSAQKARICSSVGSNQAAPVSSVGIGSAHADPPHAPSPGDYADGCLLPGDPLRAKYIAETFFDDPVEVNRRARDARLHRHVPGASASPSSRAGWAARRPGS